MIFTFPAHAEFTPETCLEISRGYWVAYEASDIENKYMTNRYRNNCSNEKSDELIFKDNHIQDIIKRLQLKGILASN